MAKDYLCRKAQLNRFPGRADGGSIGSRGMSRNHELVAVILSPVLVFDIAARSAAHAATLAFALALESTNIKVNIACPGHTGTALNNFSGIRTPERGARRAIALALIGAEGPNGTFSDENGPVAW